MAQHVEDNLMSAPSLYLPLGLLADGDGGELRGSGSSTSINLSSLECAQTSLRASELKDVHMRTWLETSAMFSLAPREREHSPPVGTSRLQGLGAHATGVFAAVLHRRPISCSRSGPARNPISSSLLK